MRRPKGVLGFTRMCGIAGYSLSPDSSVDRTLAAQALLAGIADRGADAVGYAYRRPDEGFSTVVKQRTPASRLLERIDRARERHPGARPRPRLHEGPSLDPGQQPPRAPRAGRRDPQRDHRQRRRDPLRFRLRPRRAAHDASTREAIFALAAHSRGDARAFERAPRRDGDGLVRRARTRRPLPRPRRAPAALARHAAGARSSSRPRSARSRCVERYTRIRLRKHEVREGTFVAVCDGEIVRRERFQPDHEFVEAEKLPAVRAPGETEACLSALAALAAA